MAPSLLLLTLFIPAFLLQTVTPTVAFQVPIQKCQKQLRRHQHYRRGSSSIVLRNSNNNDNSNAAAAEAEQLLAKAKAIRESLPKNENSSSSINSNSAPVKKILSDFQLQSQSLLENSYRLYLDIGREPGTWMDPRWGASGRRIDCTLDVSFVRREDTMEGEEDDDNTNSSEEPQLQLLASDEIRSALIKTVTSKSLTKSSSLSEVYKLQSAPYVRLRSGFDKMAIIDAGYCLESPANPSISASSTLRFCIEVDGTTDGDVSIPGGKLYFALAYFGTLGTNNATMNLSNKEGTITVKQMGWHTGWRREETRILGVFRAVPLEKARARDKF